MPVLSLPCTVDGIVPWAYVLVLPVMLFPHCETMRRDWQATWKVDFKYNEQANPTSLEVVLDQRDLQALGRLLRAPEPFVAKKSRAVQYGTMAGDVLKLIASMERDGHSGSVRQAVEVLLADNYRSGATLGGQKAPRNSRTLRKAWSLYQPVAHLWAAYRHGLIWSETISIPDAGVWAHPLSEECLPRLLRLAEAYRMFGLRYTPPPQEKPLLVSTDCWVVQTHTDPPWPTGEDDLPAFSLTESQRAVLTKYRAKPNRSSSRMISRKV